MKTAFLTEAEQNWLSGNTDGISKSFEYKIKSALRKKIRRFVETELPLLLKNSLFPLTVEYFDHPTTQTSGDATFSNDLGLGKAKVPGPNPGQGLPIFRK
jgi:hypothetical protein